QGPAILPPIRRKRGNRIHRLRLGAEFAARHVGRAAAPPAGAASVREGRARRLSRAQQPTQLTDALNEKGAAAAAPFAFASGRTYFFGAGAGAGAGGAACCSSFLRASSAFFCSSSCNLRC